MSGVATAAATSALTQPLLGSIHTDEPPDPNQKVETVGDRIKFWVVTGGSVVAIAAWGASMGIVRKTVMYVAGGVGAVIAPPTIIKERMLQKGRSLRGFINLLRYEVNRLMEQNDILHKEINNLEGEIDRLKVFEDKLSSIAKIQGMQVDQLVSLVDENGKVLKEMKTIVKGKILQDMIGVILVSDTNRDFKIDEQELQLLTMRLKTMFDAQGITMDIDLFQELVRFNPTLEGVLQTAKELVSEDDNDVLFKFTDGNKLRDSVMKSFTKRGQKPAVL